MHTYQLITFSDEYFAKMGFIMLHVGLYKRYSDKSWYWRDDEPFNNSFLEGYPRSDDVSGACTIEGSGMAAVPHGIADGCICMLHRGILCRSLYSRTL